MEPASQRRLGDLPARQRPGIGEALRRISDGLPAWRGQDEHAMAYGAIAYAKTMGRRQARPRELLNRARLDQHGNRGRAAALEPPEAEQDSAVREPFFNQDIGL